MDIATKILNNMPTDLNDLEKARYLYLELCKEVSFSTTFQNTDDNNFAQLYLKKVDVRNLDSTQVNCRIWSQLYSQLLNMVGIDNEIVNLGHQYVEFYCDGKKWQADATSGSYTDLSRVRNDDNTSGFGLCVFQVPDKHVPNPYVDPQIQTMLDQVDRKLGYNTDKKQNLLEFKDSLIAIRKGEIDLETFAHAGELTEETKVCFKLEYLFSTVGKLTSGYYEQKDFIYNLESMLLTDEEKQKVGAVELKRTNPDKTVDIVQCIYAYAGDEVNYYLLVPNMEVQKCSSEQITKLATLGYGIEDKQIPGIVYPKHFQRGKVSVNTRYRLYNFLNNMHLVQADSFLQEVEAAYGVR